MKKKILVSRLYPKEGIRLLEKENFHLTLWEEKRPMTQVELIEKAKSHHALLCTLTEKIDSHFLTQCSHLEIISQFAVGYDNIDIDAATGFGIPVGFTPDAMSEATADIAFGLMIAVARKMFFLHKTIINGRWGYFNPTGNLGFELKDKTLGIFGLGRIGVKMAKRCKNAYDMDIIYHNRTRNKEAEKLLDATYLGFDDLLLKSDVLSVHCALTPETKEIFNRSAFKKMKPSAIFINTARGPIHNEKDLSSAISSGEIWGTGLDVTNPEPMQPDNALLFMENACVLPHVGSGTQEARNQMSVLAAMNIIEFYRNKQVPHIVNPEVLAH
ncbi:MAG: D-glycerate dehydrogenase [Desulfobacula sp.]|jgi:glyoxylate reductase|uniref:2-hydroxyacid dehydrogenase n=1 Tax=Desulfobacula sp. TaxID=2593537 RepID=UPI001D28BEA2|nr:D-glycerate dehydrogenase [Desulfobacula sp.]MBT3487239.1 D-glycerate dehydrogenase [Desulfobacula sp.]MBT3806810.1 D-glycerate dehydrogenase [Desulfobacula sp.]MBT4027118.1 D-glycerate dehydrogenase [Desulfobacula sp.]MBT4200864.1 D-glycerate dehydrogenase [Desulfobacula sp.]